MSLTKPALQRGGEVGPRKAAEDAADHHGGVAQPDDRDARGVDGGGVFAHRAQAQPEAGAEQTHHVSGTIRSAT
jgi:hypothetical protein